jgi:hypothetical protein
MSRILRRPMFRGGRVESRGTGITSGLGYASGGQVTPKRGLVDGPGGYAGYPPTVGMGPNMTGSSYGKGFSMERLPATQSGRALGSLNQSISYNTGPSVRSGVGKELMTPAQIEELFKKNQKPGRLAKGLNYLKKIPGVSRLAGLGPYAGAAGVGYGMGALTDFYLKSTDTPLAYAKRKGQVDERGAPLEPFAYSETDLTIDNEGNMSTRGAEIDAEIDAAQLIGEAPGFFPRGGTEKWYKDRGIDPKTGQLIKVVKSDKPAGTEKPNGLGNNGTITDPVKTDRQVIQEYMDMFKENLGGDTEDLKRSRYLELAKFGANLLGQPGGQSLGEAVGRAAAPTLEGFSKIEATERAGDRQAKALGFQAALRELEPGPIRKAIKDLKKVGFSDEKAKEIATKTRDNIGEKTQEDRIKEFTKILMDSGVGTSKVSRSLAEKIEQSGLGMSGFESKEEAIKKGIIEENQLYFDKQGKTYKGKKVGDEIKLIEVQFTKSK